MAVIQISKIQVRRGLQENLPQLASGELGWSVDKRRLWIGNGTLTEGAPEIGNTEILTEGTDIVAAVTSYNFKGEESGYTSQTGASVNDFVTRKLQDKIDEQISARDFEAVGDGITDDTLALQRAIDEIWPFGFASQLPVRRKLHIPAGTYLISQPLTLPSYCYLQGDGLEATVIKQIGNGPVIKLRDSLEQTDMALGNSSSVLPSNIQIQQLQLATVVLDDVAVLEAVTDVYFHRVKFTGDILTPAADTTTKSCVLIKDTKDYKVSKIAFVNCVFTRHNHGLRVQGNIQDVTVLDCEFNTLTYGVLAQDGNIANVSPYATSITSSVFDNIAYEAIKTQDNSNTTSAFNLFKLVGHSNDTVMDSGAPIYNVINWSNSNNFSISDLFERTQANIQVKSLFAVAPYTGTMPVSQYSTVGTTQDSPGTIINLPDNISAFANTSLSLSGTTNAIINYQIVRGGNTRIGTMKVSSFQGSAVYEEEYTESANVGVQFNFVQYGTSAILNYTTSSSGLSGQFKYNLRTFV